MYMLQFVEYIFPFNEMDENINAIMHYVTLFTPLDLFLRACRSREGGEGVVTALSRYVVHCVSRL